MSKYFTNSFVRRDQEQYAKKLKMSPGSTAELKRAYLDVNFFNLAEIRALSRKFGKKSAMCLIEIYLSMSAAEGARIDEDALMDIIDDYEFENPSDFIEYCILKSLIKLFREKISDESEKDPIKSGNETRLPDYDYDYDYELIKEIDTPAIREAIRDWRIHQQKLGRSFDQMAVDALIKTYAGQSPQDLIDDINASIFNGWRNIRESQATTRRRGLQVISKTPKHNSSVTKALELMEKYKNEGQ